MVTKVCTFYSQICHLGFSCMLAYVAVYEQNIHLVHILFLSVSNAACVMVVTEQVRTI